MTRIYSSPQIRARSTAYALASCWQVAVEESDLLRERNFGEFEGQPHERVSEQLGGSMDQLEESGWYPPGGESVEQVLERAECFFDRLVNTAEPDGVYAIVSHSIPLRLLAALLKGIPMPGLCEPIPPPMSFQVYELRIQAASRRQGTFRALCLVAPREFELRESSALLSLPIDHVRARFNYALLCGSDFPKYSGTWADYPAPLLEGMPIHECVGTVIESRLEGVLPGTAILAMPLADQGLADSFVTSKTQLEPLIGWETALLHLAAFGQPTGAVLAGIERFTQPRGRRALVVGLGGIGRIATLLLLERGVQEVLGIEPNEHRANAAREALGITVFPGWNNQLTEQADLIVEAVGQDAYEVTLPMCLDAAKAGAEVLLLGNPTLSTTAIVIQPIVRKNLTILGSISPPWEVYLRRGLDFVRQNLDAFAPLVSHRFPWTESAQAFELFGDPQSQRIKILLEG